MFGLGKKNVFRDGDYVFATVNEGDLNKVIAGLVEFGGPGKVKVFGLYIRPVGLLERVQSGRAGPRFAEVLKSPHPDNLIHMLIHKVETGEFHDYVDLDKDMVMKIGAKRYTEIDVWIREGFPELFSIMLSPSDTRKDEAKQIFMDKMHNMYDEELKHTVYSVARSLRLL
ncbi:MAG: hypothetical protein ACE5JV_03550 [Nitrososphaerales archaeon]